MRVKKLAPLECPQCKSTYVSKNSVGTIECDACLTAITKAGKKEKIDKKVFPRGTRRNYPEGYFDE